MNTELKEKWVKALRSGEFKQTRGVLYDKRGGYCCLGVLCRVMEVEPLTQHAMGSQPKAALGDFDHGILVRMNDDDRKPFPEIADYIEANL